MSHIRPRIVWPSPSPIVERIELHQRIAALEAERDRYRTIGEGAVAACELLTTHLEHRMSVTNFSEQTQRISGRVDKLVAEVVALLPEGVPVKPFRDALSELLIELLSSTTILASQAVLPAAARAKLAQEQAQQTHDDIGDLRTLVREHGETIDQHGAAIERLEGSAGLLLRNEAG